MDQAEFSIGEHTSINHAWTLSALESAVRGVVQLFLDDGLVDEAQEVSLYVGSPADLSR
jgi:hypothetical protein